MKQLDQRFWGWALSSDPFVIESLARTGYDIVVCDLQHGSMGFVEAIRSIQLLDILGVPSYIRISALEIDTVPRFLDFGASGVVVATVDDAETISHAVRLSRYQPEGSRSYGGARFGLKIEPADVAEVRPAIWPMIETAEGSSNVNAIAAIPGVTGLLVGPADLSRASGLSPSHRRQHAAWNATVAEVVRVTRHGGLRSAMFAKDGTDARSWLADGFTDVVVSSDVAHLRIALAHELARARGQEVSDLVVEV